MRVRRWTRYQSHEHRREDSTMFAKLMIICAVIVAALAQAREYPAGVHPAVCPNYPYCAPDALARHTPDGIPIPQWSYPYAAAPVAPAAPVADQGGARYPASFNPALCPNYPYCW
ncbi:cuticle protein 1-like [Cydia amplana]|uniref:cuticle protein 1-like n=1 Tax=Cydia amplana TaxID=1869771 RepID=UPI002FE5B0C5